MFLKSLEIFGFKSFPDRVRVEFAEGITALLGPNGCGKSNVIDAIKWTLGEASSKALRADKMEDVIFNGTETRRQMNMAEVCLTIDNEAGLLNFEACEIAIKRRLYRSGESEYFINNQSVRLKDIKEMFWDTGVGKVAYSVMEQGKIDQILSSKPEERKYLFEEAAGITKFKIKRQEAERRLEKTEENMKVLYASVAEVKKQYDDLKVQAEKTQKYKELKDELFACEIDFQLLKLKRANDGLELKNNDEVSFREEVRRIEDEISSLDGEVSVNMDSVNAMQAELLSVQRDLAKLDVERREKERQLQLYAKMEGELREKIQVNEARVAASRERLSNIIEEIDEKRGEIILLEKKYSDIEANIGEFEENIGISSNKLKSNIQEIQRRNQEIKDAEKELSYLSLSLKQITEDIVKELDEKLKGQGASIQEKEKQAEELTFEIEKLITFASERVALVKDFTSMDMSGEAGLDAFLQKMDESFEETVKLAKELKERFELYKNVSGFFIDEFLSPQGIITKKRRIDDDISCTKEKIENERNTIEQLEIENAKIEEKIEEYKKTLTSLRIEKEKRKAEIQGVEKEADLLEKNERGERERLEELEVETASANEKMQRNIDEKLALEGEINVIDSRGATLLDEMQDLQTTIQERNAFLSGNKKRLEELTQKRMEALSSLEKLQMAKVAFETEIKNIKENFKETYSRQIVEFEQRISNITMSQSQLREKQTKMRTELASMGSVNFMAIEEFKEKSERYEFLNGQLQDLEKARNDLKRITEEIKAESTQLFVMTYQKIKRNFHNMFRRLFGGGRAEVRLTDPNNVLDSGIDIFAQPPGKKLENIGLLSGGEKSMTAVSLLFATYMVKPSPFCLLDEIDAALDEQNVMRFIHTLKEFANVSQYIVITHNKKTVVGANAMLGVTMEESGVSKMIAIKLDTNFEALKKEDAIANEKFEDEDVEVEEVMIPSRPAKRIKEE